MFPPCACSYGLGRDTELPTTEAYTTVMQRTPLSLWRLLFKFFLGLWLVAVGCSAGTGNQRFLQNPIASPVPTLGPGREVVLWVDPSFSTVNQQAVSSEYASREILEHLGVRVVYMLNGELSDGSSTINQRIGSTQPTRTVYVYNWLNTDADSGTIGVYPYRTNRLYLDETRINTPREFRTVFLHEFGHWAGLKHVCATLEQLENERLGCDLTVPVGPAVMNPFISNNTPEGYTPLDDRERQNQYSI